jgi:nucleotide-binding universal stress UspA family protein
MTEDLTRMIVIPVDGSERSLNSIEYVYTMYGTNNNVEVKLFYVLPQLPPILEDEQTKSREVAQKIKAIENKNLRRAEKILAQARDKLVSKGFAEDRIEAIHQKRLVGIARDTCNWADNERADAVAITTRGLSKIEAFFMGEISSKLIEFCRIAPVWIVGGRVDSNKVLIGVDSSEYAMRAVDHAGFMLSGTDAEVILFHTLRRLSRFMPPEVLEAAPDIEEIWERSAEEEITPYMEKAKAMLLDAGLNEKQVTTKVVKGTDSPANDILQEAQASGIGTIVLGQRGYSGVMDFLFGSITKKVIENSAERAVWVVQ